MLEVATEDRAHADVLAEPGDTGTQAADAADRQIDLHARVAGCVQRIDQLGIAQRVQLGRDATLGAQGHLVLDQVEELAAHVTRRDQQRVVVVGTAVAGEVVEELGHVVAHRRIAGEEPDVFVEARRPRVVVARADVAVAP